MPRKPYAQGEHAHLTTERPMELSQFGWWKSTYAILHIDAMQLSWSVPMTLLATITTTATTTRNPLCKIRMGA